MSESLLRADGVFRWYRPDDPSDATPVTGGTLEISPEGVSTLSLVGVLLDAVDSEEYDWFRSLEGRWIVGALKDQRFVLLGRLSKNTKSIGVPVTHETFRARDCIVFRAPESFPSIDQAKSLVIDIEPLGNWLGEAGIQVAQLAGGPVLRGDAPTELPIPVGDRTVLIKQSVQYSAPVGLLSRKATLEQQTRMELKFTGVANLERVRREFLLLEDLLLLLTDSDVTLPWPTVFFEGSSGMYYFEHRAPKTADLVLFASWMTWRETKECYSKLLLEFERQRDVLGPGLSLYLALRRETGLYVDHRFATAAFGLESMHRRVGKSNDATKLMERVQRILEGITGDDDVANRDRAWFEKRFKYVAEPSLEERLVSTFSELDIDLQLKELRVFCQKCAALRNQVAHFGGPKDDGYADFMAELKVFEAAISPMYHAVLLQKIGVEPKYINRYFNHTSALASPFSIQRKRVMERAGLAFSENNSVAASRGMPVKTRA